MRRRSRAVLESDSIKDESVDGNESVKRPRRESQTATLGNGGNAKHGVAQDHPSGKNSLLTSEIRSSG